jgi:hypothetical protein
MALVRKEFIEVCPGQTHNAQLLVSRCAIVAPPDQQNYAGGGEAAPAPHQRSLYLTNREFIEVGVSLCEWDVIVMRCWRRWPDRIDMRQILR